MEAFLGGTDFRFRRIAATVAETLRPGAQAGSRRSVAEVLEIDRESREVARELS